MLNWIDDYPELNSYLIQLYDNTDISRKGEMRKCWLEFIDELRVELDKPRCGCKFSSDQRELYFGDEE